MSYRDEPTCELGFWKPMHAGCPKCGPNGPCIDPEYEALIQAEAEKDRFRRVLWRVCLVVVAAVVLLAVAGCTTTGPGSPPEFRLQPVAYPAIPEPGVPCRHDPARLCNTDEETAGVLSGYDAALTEANTRLCWLAHYLGQEPEGCRVE